MSEREKGAFVYKGAGRRSKMTEDAAPEQRLCDTFHVQMQRTHSGGYLVSIQR